MSSIDNRIVDMKFDNKQFEQGVKKTMDTLDKFNKSLDFTDETKSVDGLNKSLGQLSLDGINKSLEALNNKFSTLSIIGITALTNIANSAINTGKTMIKALTIDPIKTGFQEYETQINAVQTILANTSSKGTTIDQVNDALAELNKYADMTIYNFTEMTRNIGTFTAAGVDLDTSVKAIKGIANLAAVSGSNAQQASTAMYQLSQALSSGTVKLQDWNSVVNAGMGGQVFQDALKETARLHGVGIDQMIEEQGSFRETLSEGWLSSKILLETLEKFTGDLNEEQLRGLGYSEEQITEIIKLGKMANDAATKVKTFTQLVDTLKEAAQSGWTQSWQIIAGDFEEAKLLFTEISDVVGAMIGKNADGRNAMLQGWKDLGGRTMLIEALWNIFNTGIETVTAFKDVMTEIFPPKTGQDLFNLTKMFHSFSEALEWNDEVLNNLKRALRGVLSVLDVAIYIVSSVAKGFLQLFKTLMPATGGFTSLAGSAGDALFAFRNMIKGTDLIGAAFNVLNAILSNVVIFVRGVTGAFASLFKGLQSSETEGIDGFAVGMISHFTSLQDLINAFATKISEMKISVQQVTDFFVGAITAIGTGLKWVASKLGDMFGSLSVDPLVEIAKGGMLFVIFKQVKTFIESLTSITDNAGGLLENLTGILDGVQGSLEAWQNNLKAKTLMALAGAVGILAAALFVLASIDSDKLVGAMGTMTALFLELFGAMAVFEKMQKSGGFKSITSTIPMLISLGITINLLAAALVPLSKIPFTSLVKGLGAIGAMFVMLVGVSQTMQGAEKGMVKMGASLIVFAAALRILVPVVERLSLIKASSLGKATMALAALFAELVIFSKLMNGTKLSPTTAVALIAVSQAISMLTGTLERLSLINSSSLIKAMGSLGIVLAELALFTRFTGNSKGIFSTSIALIALAKAVDMLQGTMAKFANMTPQQLTKGMLALASTLTILAGTLRMMPTRGMVTTGAGLILVATAVNVLSFALEKFGSMTKEQLAKSMLALGSAFTIFAVSANLMKGTLGASASMVVMAGALAMLVPQLLILSMFSWSGILKSLVALAGVFGVIGGAALLLGPLAPALLGLSVALGVLGAAIAVAGVGILALGAGRTAMSVAGKAGVDVIIHATTQLSLLLPTIFSNLATAILAFLTQIIAGANTITTAMTTLLASILTAIITNTPLITTAVSGILIGILQVIQNTTPQIAETLVVLIEAVSFVLVSSIPLLTQTVLDIGLSMLQAFRDRLPEFVTTGADIMVAFMDGIAENIGRVIDSGFNIVVQTLYGIANAIEENGPALWDAGWAIIMAIFNAITYGISRVPSMGLELVQGLINGVVDMIWNAKDAASNVISSMFDSFVAGISSVPQIGVDMIQGLINGITSMAGNLWDAGVNAVSGMFNGVKSFLGIASPSKKAKQVGVWFDEGLIGGIKSLAGKVKDSGVDLGRKALDGLNGVMENVTSVLDGSMQLAPVITPTVDMSPLERDLSQIDNAFNKSRTLNIDQSRLRNERLETSRRRQGGQPDEIDQNRSTSEGNTTNYYQTINSPKSVSEAETYRLTKLALEEAKRREKQDS